MSKRKAPSQKGPNSDIVDILLEIAEYEKNVTRNTYKYNAYRRAAAVLSEYKTRIKSGKEAKKLEGIGAKIAEKIDEYLTTGKVSKLEKIRNSESTSAINSLTRVFGIGPSAAKKFVDKGIDSTAELKKHQNLLTDHQKIGLKYLDDFEKKIPRKEIEKIENIIVDEVKELDSKFKIMLCGSYRRGADESGDIDVLITHKDYDSTNKKKSDFLKNIIEKLEDVGLLKEKLSFGEFKYMGVCQLSKGKEKHLHRRIDIRLFPHDQFYCAVLYFTGSALFNQHMRAHALEQGFTLNEYCLRPLGIKGTPGEPVPISNEREIFEYIDFPYKKPENRNT